MKHIALCPICNKPINTTWSGVIYRHGHRSQPIKRKRTDGLYYWGREEIKQSCKASGKKLAKLRLDIKEEK